MLQITINGKKVYHIPEHWNELTKEQLLRCSQVLNRVCQRTDMLVRLLEILSGFNSFTFFTMPVYHINQCLKEIEWILEGVTLTRQLLPEYKGLYGPASELANLTAKEFAMTEFFFLRYRNDGELDALDELIAILYRPKKKGYRLKENPGGDVRVKFNEHSIPFYKRKVSRWPSRVKWAIAQFYEGCRNEFLKNYQPVFEGNEEGKAPPYGMWNIMRDIAESGVFGDFDKVEEQFVDTLLMEIHTQIEKADDLKAKMKKMQNV